jgi:hypothetical protein
MRHSRSFGRVSSISIGDSPIHVTRSIGRNAVCTDAELAIISELPALSLLEISRGRVSYGGLNHLQATQSLSTLILVETRLEQSAQGVSLPYVKWLEFRSCVVEDSSLSLLAQMPSLNSLIVDRTTVSCGFATAIPPCTEFVCLRSLRLCDDDIRALARHPHLRSIVLEGCCFSSNACAMLGESQSIESVSVANTHIGDVDMGHLLGMPTLKRLNLSSTEVSDSGLDLLGSSETLEQVDVSDTCVTADGVATARRERPHIRIVYSPKLQARKGGEQRCQGQ